MRKPDDAMLLIHDHLVGVCLDLVEVDEDDYDEMRQDMAEMVEIILDSLQIKLTSRSETEQSIDFNCQISIPNQAT